MTKKNDKLNSFFHSSRDNIIGKPLVYFNLSFGRLNVEIETKRLLICSYKDDDFESCFRLYSNKTLTKYFDNGKPRTEIEVKKLICEKADKYFSFGKPFGLFSIFHKKTMDFIGQIDLLPTDEPGIAEIGFILHEQYQNQGFCTEAVNAVVFDYIGKINECFECNELPISKIIATAHPQNLSSRKVLEKIGMTLDKVKERFGNPRLWYSLPLIIKN